MISRLLSMAWLRSYCIPVTIPGMASFVPRSVSEMRPGLSTFSRSEHAPRGSSATRATIRNILAWFVIV